MLLVSYLMILLLNPNTTCLHVRQTSQKGHIIYMYAKKQIIHNIMATAHNANKIITIFFLWCNYVGVSKVKKLFHC